MLHDILYFAFVFVVHNDGHFCKKKKKKKRSLCFVKLSKTLSLPFTQQIILLWNICYTIILVDVFLELLTNPSNVFQWPDVYFKQLLNTISDFMDPDLLQALQFCFQSTCIVFVLHWRRVGNIPQPMWDGFPQMLINGHREMLLVSRVGCWGQSG